MTERWQVATLKDMCVVDWGNTNLTKSAYVDEGEYLAVSAAGCDGRIGHKEHARGTPVLSAIGAQCGKMFFPEEDFTAIKNTITLTPRPDICTGKFLYYLLTFIELPQRGAGQPFISKGDIQSFAVSYPPLPEQRRIVAILDEAFEGIATAKANAEKNLQNARYLFATELEVVFGNPSCSPWMPIRDLGEVYDGPHATPATVDSGPIFLGISALKDGLVDLAETRHVTSEDFLRWTRRVTPKGGDIVFSYETRLGQAALIPEGLLCCLGRRMGLVRVDQARVDPRFFTFQFVSPPFRRFLTNRVIRGATVDRIGLKEFPSFPVWLPELSEQQRVADQLDNLRVETRNLERICARKLATFDELKKSLLHQAFTGAL